MGSLNLDKMKSKLENESKSGGGYSADYDKLVDGKNVRRILWPKGSKEEFWSEGYLHFSLGAEGKSVCTCPKTFSAKNKCPICEEAERLAASKDKDDKKLAQDIKARRRIYINVLNRDDDEEEETPKVLPIGVTILKGLLEAICDPDYGDITDFDEGRDMTIKKTGKGLNTEYSVLPKPKSSVASEELSKEELEEKMADLDALFIEKSYEELEALLNGEDLNDEDDDDDKDAEDGEDVDYDEMDQDELEALCKKRGIKLPASYNRGKLVILLEKWDVAHEDDDDSDDEEDSEEEDSKSSGSDDGDDLQDEIAQALAARNKKKGK